MSQGRNTAPLFVERVETFDGAQRLKTIKSQNTKQTNMTPT
jgi:hypothetical protein